MASKTILWLVDQPERRLIGSILNEAGYDVSFVDNQVISREKKELENWKLLIMDMGILQQTDRAVTFLEKLRRLSKCKVLMLSKSEFYPLLRENRFKIDHLIDCIISYPFSKEELLVNARRCLEP